MKKKITAKELFEVENKNRSNENYKKIHTMILAMYERMRAVIKRDDWEVMETSWLEVKKQPT